MYRETCVNHDIPHFYEMPVLLLNPATYEEQNPIIIVKPNVYLEIYMKKGGKKRRKPGKEWRRRRKREGDNNRRSEKHKKR